MRAKPAMTNKCLRQVSNQVKLAVCAVLARGMRSFICSVVGFYWVGLAVLGFAGRVVAPAGDRYPATPLPRWLEHAFGAGFQQDVEHGGNCQGNQVIHHAVGDQPGQQFVAGHAV